MVTSKQHARPFKKGKTKAAGPETADDFQEAADFEEDAGGKWRAGDAAKSSRAFLRALEIYDQGLQRYPKNFDLAYNKARLELELTLQPALVAHVGMPLIDLLQQTLTSHRYALKLNSENHDLLFNTAQVLTSLAEQLAGTNTSGDATRLLQEALELLSSCLSRQEIALEEHRADLAAIAEDTSDGGVSVDVTDELTTATMVPGSEIGEEAAIIEIPVTLNELLDTVHASVNALTTMVSLVEPSAVQILGDMAQSLTEAKAPEYIAQLSREEQSSARFALALTRATFVAAFADAQFQSSAINLDTYIDRLSSFDFDGKEQDATALCSEAEARTDLSISVLSIFDASPDLPVASCWKQLTLAQDLYSKAAKLDPSSQIYLSRGDVEMLRHRLATTLFAEVSISIRRAAETLINNALTYYKGAARLAPNGEPEIKATAQRRLLVAIRVKTVVYNANSSNEEALDISTSPGDLRQALAVCVEDGLISVTVANDVARVFARAQ